MLVDTMPLKILVSAGAPAASGEWSPANRMPELALAIFGIEWEGGGGGLYGTAESRIFHRTPAEHTAEKKTRRKRNRSCYGLLSVPRQPPSPSPLPHCTSIAPPAATLSGLAEGRLLPLPTVPPPPPWLNLCDFQHSRPKARTASI
jgi:hypothetical protein